MNIVLIIGRLGKDPELRRSQSGAAFCNFSVATTERKKEGDNWVEYAEWHSIVTFGKTAENCAQYLKKGSQVAIEGSIRTRKWENKEGETRYSTEIVASSIEFIGSRATSDREQEQSEDLNKTSYVAQKTKKEEPQTNLDFDDIPF